MRARKSERARQIEFGNRWDAVAERFGWRVIGYTDDAGATFAKERGYSFSIHGQALLQDFERGLMTAPPHPDLREALTGAMRDISLLTEHELRLHVDAALSALAPALAAERQAERFHIVRALRICAVNRDREEDATFVDELADMVELLPPDEGKETLTTVVARARQAERERCAKVAESFTCGLCGLDGRTAAAIRALPDVPADASKQDPGS